MEDLLNEIDAFCAAHDLSDTRFGELALNDKPFVAQLRAGRDIRMSTVEKVRAFMRDWQASEPRADAA